MTRWMLAVTVAAGVAGAAEIPGHVATTPTERKDEEGRERFAQILALTKTLKPQIVFLGDSITQHWEWDEAGLASWEKYWKPLGAANCGISADRTEHVLWRLDHGHLDGWSPKVIVLHIGTNNSGHPFEEDGYRCTPEQTADGVRAILGRLRAKCPDAKILLMAVFPRGESPDDRPRKSNEAVNRILRTFDDGRSVFFMDIGPKLLKPDGHGDEDIMPDMLHMTPKGYAIWSKAIEPKVRELMK